MPRPHRLAPLVSQLDGLQPRLFVRQGGLGSVLARMVIDPRVLVDRDQEGMGIAGKGMWDRFADQRDGLGGGFLALLRAFVAAALLASACLLSRGHVSRTVYLSIFVYFRG